ncbi:copper radical oxidase [Lactarius akahatsu]|uniref:Copper radical oxidase n=1 Tax=Lactarius akahatsu TaxID=416441 RepID=A0AAD4LJJ0_9AGAM|nr:copper radical oxidase [Lactarius akahatsu]
MPHNSRFHTKRYRDNAHRHDLQTELVDNRNVTAESCITSCASHTFTLARLERGVQCFCDNKYVLDGASTVPDSDCKTDWNDYKISAAEIDSSESRGSRGGLNRIYIYISGANATVSVVPTVQTTGLPGKWQYSRCLAEPEPNHVFPYNLTLANNNSAQNCLSQCSAFGYPAAGMENDKCWCGDAADITDNGGKTAAESDCSTACSGDPLHLCGGTWRLQLYLWNGTLNTWGTPANIGRYEYLVPGLVPPLLATVGINGKVSFLEKGSESGYKEFENATSAYELDLSLVHDFSHAWREMHVKTDVFCSAAVVLPDKAARILNVGGWSSQSSLTGRWYPTAHVLSNGSVLVMGGENGAGGAASSSVEILPRIPGVIHEWYYNEARLLDPVTFATVKVLPDIPGSVGNSLAGRNYPYEGTSALLPQHAPYTDESTVLICGGSDSGGNALDNCVSMQPEAANPAWVIERMPSKRVMPCIVALPDGTSMVMNGAQQGIAGFGVSDNPNLSALLYDPSQPVGARISILNTTTIARLYHSEATLLPDGRVLVSGSDPNPTGTQTFPEELRIEVYIPPYLNNGLTQPIVSIPNTDWAYGGQYQINVQLFHGQTSGMSVSLIAATVEYSRQRHGRPHDFPRASPPGWHQLFILDGKTPSHGVFVRIGGDPAKLGNWPALPGFNPPGL